MFPPEYGDAVEERRLAYVAITRGMRRVTTSHADCKRGHASPSCFIADIPHAHRMPGWLRGPATNAARNPASDRIQSDAKAAIMAIPAVNSFATKPVPRTALAAGDFGTGPSPDQGPDQDGQERSRTAAPAARV